MLTTKPFPDQVALRKAFALYPSGIAALAAQTDGADHVIIAASFSVGISLDPPPVAFAVQRESTRTVAPTPELTSLMRISYAVFCFNTTTISAALWSDACKINIT